jgi:hypothetical protein
MLGSWLQVPAPALPQNRIPVSGGLPGEPQVSIATDPVESPYRKIAPYNASNGG